jgi:hypothetical protein
VDSHLRDPRDSVAESRLLLHRQQPDTVATDHRLHGCFRSGVFTTRFAADARQIRPICSPAVVQVGSRDESEPECACLATLRTRFGYAGSPAAFSGCDRFPEQALPKSASKL